MRNLGKYNTSTSVPRKEDVDARQEKITASGLLRGDGNGNVSEATTVESSSMDIPNGLLKGVNGDIQQAASGTDYMPPVPVTSDDNGKVMQVVNGTWVAQMLPTYGGEVGG